MSAAHLHMLRLLKEILIAVCTSCTCTAASAYCTPPSRVQSMHIGSHRMALAEADADEKSLCSALKSTQYC